MMNKMLLKSSESCTKAISYKILMAFFFSWLCLFWAKMAPKIAVVLMAWHFQVVCSPLMSAANSKQNQIFSNTCPFKLSSLNCPCGKAWL